ncbi:MAG: transporter [Burkholderiales bacterium]|nr:transporter [Burkholderiales bacterium]
MLATLLAAAASSPALAEGDAELAKATQNPIAALISLPLQYNYDSDIGPVKDGHKSQLNVQPVIPFSIGTDWNLISRTIVPLISQNDVTPGAGTQSGIGDITQSLFFSPKKPTASGWIWGAGPVFLLPAGHDDLTADKWGAGPTAVLLKQDSGWTYGALANHIWSFAGADQRRDISSTFVQPFLSYTTKTYTTFGINTESTYDWKSEKWSVPINLSATQLLKIGGQPMTLSAGARYWADSPEGVGPKGWGFRLTATFLFPK